MNIHIYMYIHTFIHIDIYCIYIHACLHIPVARDRCTPCTCLLREELQNQTRQPEGPPAYIPLARHARGPYPTPVI